MGGAAYGRRRGTVLGALTTCLSLAAQWLLNYKRIETWWFWIAADVIYIPLYATKALDLTAIVYAGFLGMCLAGMRSWHHTLHERAPTEPPVDVVAA